MRLIIGADHAGYRMKESLREFLISKGFVVEDAGTDSVQPVDYPDIAARVAKKIQDSDNLGILICGTGIGMSIAANKFRGIRAALCHDVNTARMAREHNNANVLCIGARIVNEKEAKKISEIFLSTEHSDDERHRKRVEKIIELEKVCIKA